MRLMLSILSFALLSCTPKPPDVFVFENLESRLSTDPSSGHAMLAPSPACDLHIHELSCGHGISIVSGKEIYVGEEKSSWFSGKPWSQLKRESIYVPAVESYAPIAAYMINACKKTGCDKQVDVFKVKLDSFNNVKAIKDAIQGQ